jgi:hypothetical protein
MQKGGEIDGLFVQEHGSKAACSDIFILYNTS